MSRTHTLLLRTDGGPEIGGGHVMRCLALAQAWREEGGRALFVAATISPALEARLAQEGFTCQEVAAPRGGAEDLAATIATARAEGAGAVVVDGYCFPPAYRQGLRDAGFKVAAIDDNDEIGACVDDLVINQSCHASEALYRERAPHTRLLLGTDYALLRREFREWQGPPRQLPPVARRILITFGAADGDNITGQVIGAVGPVLPTGTQTTVLIGGSNPHAQVIDAQAAGQPDFRVLRDQREAVPDLMAEADLAVSAGGSTMWELAFLAVPFVIVVIAANQRAPAEAMAAEGFPVLQAADVRDALPDVVARLIADRGRRSLLSKLGRRLVDGEGGVRVSRALRELIDAG
jgi:UDP-2,4-diacetamido-2,4,6-trideoxy-beta-L-altropyranose hydrolase